MIESHLQIEVDGGPSLLEDFHFLEKMAHFDQERIPERVVHARGSGAHGYFQVYKSLSKYTKAAFLQDPSEKTPVFVRFSNVQGFRGSPDTVRDIRGFATKFYTREGNYDLVGNDTPVFFIQDSIKFPDFIHAVKPEPHNEMPQGQTAHDSFWDYVSLQPETLHNVRTIHALGLESYMEQRYDQRIGESYAAMEKTNFYDAIYSPVVFLLNAAVVGIVMLLSASGNADVLALFGMSVGTSVAIINYISRIFSPIESLGMEIQTIQSAMAGVKRIDAFLNQPERAISQERKNTARGDVVLSHVTFGYGEKPVLSDFSMTVKEGEQVTLVGRTGAGKSTVFRLLLGLYQPEKGDITIGGVNVSAITDHERRACIGCVEQHFSRVPGTVLDQITLSDPAITEGMAQNAAKLAGMDDAIRALPDGYNTICTDGMFSQGEWQLLSIARAAAANPAVLLLDEITANLDAETEARVLEALRRASEGRTVLSISHRIYENLGGRTVELKPCEVQSCKIPAVDSAADCSVKAV